MKTTLFVCILAMGIMLGASAGVQAEMRAGAFNLTPMIGGYVFEGNQNLDHSLTGGLGLGYAFDPHWGAELFFNYIDAELDTGTGDVDGYLYRLDALYHFMPERRLVPYLAAGLGGITLDPDGGSRDSSFLLNAGGGLKYFLTESVALRGDVRYVVPFDETHNNLLYMVGIDFLFGGGPKAVAAAAEPVKDSDRDGVSDDLDQCPDTPAGVTVDGRGCPLDSDGDGVYDYQDQCPDTPVGLKVDANGCPILLEEKVSMVLDIEFDINRTEIKPQYHEQLKEVADFLKTYPNTTAVIEGHTDDTGEAAYNQDLSQRRADSVRTYLITHLGVAADRLTAKGYGEEQPVASNATAAGRAQNRRVVAVISASKTTYQKK